MLYETSLQAGNQRGGGREDEVGTFLHRRVREILLTGTGESGQGEGRGDIDEGILGYLLRKQHAVEGCDDLNGVAVSGYGMYEELGGGDVRVPGGFSRVVDALAGKVSQCCCREREALALRICSPCWWSRSCCRGPLCDVFRLRS